MNIVTYIIGNLVRSRKYGRALALLPLLGKIKSADILSGARKIVRYFASGNASKKDIIYLVLVVAYFFSPINFASLPFGGFIIDAGIITFLLTYLFRRANEFTEKQT